MAMAINSRVLRVIPLLIAICFVSFPAQAQYSGGTGELNDPYQIATAEDLMLLGDSPEDYDKHFILTADHNAEVLDSSSSCIPLSQLAEQSQVVSTLNREMQDVMTMAVKDAGERSPLEITPLIIRVVRRDDGLVEDLAAGEVGVQVDYTHPGDYVQCYLK